MKTVPHLIFYHINKSVFFFSSNNRVNVHQSLYARYVPPLFRVNLSDMLVNWSVGQSYALFSSNRRNYVVVSVWRHYCVLVGCKPSNLNLQVKRVEIVLRISNQAEPNIRGELCELKHRLTIKMSKLYGCFFKFDAISRKKSLYWCFVFQLYNDNCCWEYCGI